jgi:hypothetical protein
LEVEVNKMTKKEKLLVACCKDALKQIKAKRYHVGTGAYCVLPEMTYDVAGSFIGKQLQKVLPKMNPCTVCAKGALFLSLVRKKNSFKLSEDTINSGEVDVFPKLKKHFNQTTIALMECAFEGPHNVYTALNADEEKATDAFSERYDDDVKRLKAILKNVIKNRGQFKP